MNRRRFAFVCCGVVMLAGPVAHGDRNAPRDNLATNPAQSPPQHVPGVAVSSGVTDSGRLAQAGGAHLDLRPIRTLDGTVVGVGDTIVLPTVPQDVLLEGYFGGWGSSGHLLKYWLLQMDPSGLSNGVGGALGRAAVTCATDADCRDAFDTSSNVDALLCSDFEPGRCNVVFQDLEHPARLNMSGFGLVFCAQPLFICTDTTFGAGAPDPGVDRYGLSVVLHVPATASGTYDLSLLVFGGDASILELSNGSIMPIASNGHAFIRIRPDDACVGGSAAGAACTQHSDCPGGFCHLKNRFVSFLPPTLPGNPTTGMQVTLVDLDSNSVANPAAYNGTVRWLGPPVLNVNDGTAGTFVAAKLQCGFHSQDWSAIGRVHAYGGAVLPSSLYDVRACATTGGPCTAPIRIATAKWGDVVPPLVMSQPNFTDISALVEKFRGSVGAPSKTRAKLHEPVDPTLPMSTLELASGVDAFQGKTYKQGNPAPPTCP